MLLISQIKLKISEPENVLRQKVQDILHCKPDDIVRIDIKKKSLDARKKPDLFWIFSVVVTTRKDSYFLKRAKGNQISSYRPVVYHFPTDCNRKLTREERPVICGMGPAGLFCAYELALHGFQPILIERGKMVDQRVKDVEDFWETGKLQVNSNVQFGEGGAGTFSDGKLNTLVKDKYGRNTRVLEVFTEHGAPAKILYEGKPHIGTDILLHVVKSMRETILEKGGEIHFETCLKGIKRNFQTDGGIESITIKKPDGGEEIWKTRYVVLALGHSARDTFQMLYSAGLEMEAKPFAVGFRVEHPQKMIDLDQYGRVENDFPAAPYKLATDTSYGRSVYSFCMCPGGYVVNASSEEGMLAVNGMSYSGRNGQHANSAIIVTVSPDDYPGNHPLSGIAFQRALEKKAFEVGDGKIPTCSLQEFQTHRLDVNDNNGDCWEPQTKGKSQKAPLWEILPEDCNQAFLEAMGIFDRKIKGFADPRTVLDGIESRTSSPVRIIRDDVSLQSCSGLFPCGEGAGYAGGITSAAMDGLKVAEKIAELLVTAEET